MSDPVTAPTPDAVAQARREVLDARDNALRNISMEAVARLDAAWDAYESVVGAAVRAECAAKVDAQADALDADIGNESAVRILRKLARTLEAQP